MSGTVPGSQYVYRLVNFGSPEVRERFPRGVLVNPRGYPEWKLCARAMVRLPEPTTGLTVDEVRVVDVLAANAVMARGDDPLWDAVRDDPVVRTPQGWTWAHIGLTRDVALVPVELHASYRHAGGMSTLAVDRDERGLRVDYETQPAEAYQFQEVPDEILLEVERHLPGRLPPSYRAFLAQTNGAAPYRPGVLPGSGFVADQRFFGLGRADVAQDIAVANSHVADRFTDEFLAIGYVQGGTIVLKVRGDDADSIWYWDHDDYRADQDHDARYICGNLLYRCADSIRRFWDQLAVPSRSLLATVERMVVAGEATEIRPDAIGDSLPIGYRAPRQPAPIPDEEYFNNEIIKLALLRPADPA